MRWCSFIAGRWHAADSTGQRIAYNINNPCVRVCVVDFERQGSDDGGDDGKAAMHADVDDERVVRRTRTRMRKS